MKSPVAIMSVAFVLYCPIANAGAVLELLTTEYSEDPPIIGTIEISTQGKESRIEITSVSSNESGGMIYRSKKKELIALDHAAREYYVIDQTTMDNMAAQVRASMAQTEAALNAMTPEERTVAEQLMQRAPSPDAASSELKPTGKTDTIAGYACKYYDVLVEGRKIRDICMTPWNDIAEGRQAAQAMKELAEFFENMRKAFADAGGLDVMDRQQQMFAYMEKLDGYPVLARDYDDGGALESESRLQAVHSKKINESMFEPPRSYQQRVLQ